MANRKSKAAQRATTTTKTTASSTPTTNAPTSTGPASTTAAKPAAAQVMPSSPKATIVEDVTPTVSALPIKKPELIDRVVEETGMKKKDVKPVVEAMLTVLGRTLAGGEDLTVPPLGKVMVKRIKDVANAKIMTVKVRQPLGENGPRKAALAQDED